MIDEMVAYLKSEKYLNWLVSDKNSAKFSSALNEE